MNMAPTAEQLKKGLEDLLTMIRKENIPELEEHAKNTIKTELYRLVDENKKGQEVNFCGQIYRGANTQEMVHGIMDAIGFPRENA